jgi:uncharacterized protein YjbI with pentapeptide repeats/WD40 repeat protein/tetratricopeptide (TPR) repeat protein
LQAAFSAAQQASAYRFDGDMVITVSGADGTQTEIRARFAGDAQPPDRMRSAITETVGGAEVETQVLVIGDTKYVQNPLTDRWYVEARAETLFNPTDLTADASAVQGLELLGEQMAKGMPVYHLTGRARLPFTFGPPAGQAEGDMLVSYWISRQDQRLLWSTVEGQIGLTGEISATADLSMTLRLFDYGVPLEIAAPEISGATALSVPGVGPIAIEATLLAPLESDSPEGHVRRGLASLADGRFGLALAHFDQALALRPDWTEALLYRGATLAINGSVDVALSYLDEAIEAEPGRADAYALRAWVYASALSRQEIEGDVAIPQARADITQALALDPGLSAAVGLKAMVDLWEALGQYESEPEQAQAGLEAAMAKLEATVKEDPDAVAGSYLVGLMALSGLKAEDRAWLASQADAASAQIAADPESYVALSVRGLMNLYLGSQPSPDVQTLAQAGEDLLTSVALAHRRMPGLANPEGGPLQVARIWEVEEAAYTTGMLYNQVFFGQNPQSFPEFAQMLASYWELLDLYFEAVDDPIVFSVAFSPDGSQIATLSESGPSYLRLWDAATGEKLHEVELGLDGQVIATTNGNLDYSPDGSHVVAAYTNSVARVIDARTGEVTQKIDYSQAEHVNVHSAAFSPDGKRIVTVNPDTASPEVWDVETGERVLTVTVGSAVSTVTFSPDGRHIVGGGEQVQVWDAETGRLVTTLPGSDSGYAGSPAISPDGKLLAVPGTPVRVYDLVLGTELYAIALGGRAVAFSPDGVWLATAGYDAVGVWSAETGAPLFLAGHPQGVDAVDWSPDGLLLVTGGSDGRFRVWDVGTGAELRTQMAATTPAGMPVQATAGPVPPAGSPISPRGTGTPPVAATPAAAHPRRTLPAGCPPACASASLSGIELRGSVLTDADFSGADLSQAQLSGADLSDANLKGADLRGAHLQRAEMNGADLSGADLRGADLRGANLRDAILRGAVADDTTRFDDKWRLAWEIVNKGGEGRNLSGVDLNGADLRQARLAGADLSGAQLVTANLRGADLKGANLRGADLDFAELQGADLTGADLSEVELTFPKLDDTTRIDPKWRLAWQIDSKGMPGADLANVDLSGTNLHGGNLKGANLAGANLSNANLFHCDLSGADLRGANLLRADLFDAPLQNADFRGADLSYTILINADLTGAKLEGANLLGARYSSTTVWPAGFAPPVGTIKQDDSCFTDEQGKKRCYNW